MRGQPPLRLLNPPTCPQRAAVRSWPCVPLRRRQSHGGTQTPDRRRRAAQGQLGASDEKVYRLCVASDVPAEHLPSPDGPFLLQSPPAGLRAAGAPRAVPHGSGGRWRSACPSGRRRAPGAVSVVDALERVVRHRLRLRRRQPQRSHSLHDLL